LRPKKHPKDRKPKTSKKFRLFRIKTHRKGHPASWECPFLFLESSRNTPLPAVALFDMPYQERMNTVISIKAFFWAAYQGSFLFFVSVFRPSVSDPFPYLSYRPYLPLPTSFSRCLSSFRHEGAQRRQFCLCVLS